MTSARASLYALRQLALLRTGRRRVMRDLREKLREQRLVSHASAISFQLLFALLPLALFALALMSLVGHREVWTDELAPLARDHLSATAFRLVDSTVEQIMTSKRTLWLTVGLALALWKLSAAVRVTMDALDAIYETGTRHPFPKRLVRSLALAVVGGSCLTAAAAIVVIGGRAARGEVPAVLSGALRWSAAAALMLVAAALILRYAPAKRQPYGWLTVGSVLVTVSWIVTSLLFALYTTTLATWSTLFGGLTTLIVVMFYLYASSIAFLLGAQLDALLREEVDSPTAKDEAPRRAEDGRPASAVDAERLVRGA